MYLNNPFLIELVSMINYSKENLSRMKHKTSVRIFHDSQTLYMKAKLSLLKPRKLIFF